MITSPVSIMTWDQLLSTVPDRLAYLPVVVRTRSPRFRIHIFVRRRVAMGHAVAEGRGVRTALRRELRTSHRHQLLQGFQHLSQFFYFKTGYRNLPKVLMDTFNILTFVLPRKDP